jgi:Mrp family chromosome partitioning ATPase
MLDALRDEFDLILLDGPPVSPVADALVIAQAADHILLVLEWRRTPRQLVRMLQESLSRLGCGITGVVMTKTPVRNGAYGVQFSQYSSKYGYVQD